jgi:hypothetical protein
VLLNSALTANPSCKPLSGEISVQNIPHAPVYSAGFAGYITLDEKASETIMTNEDCTREASLKLSIGHLLAVWDVLANKLSESNLMDSLSEEQRRAMCALEDLCESSLVENGISGRPEPEWNELMRTAYEHVKSIPVEFYD